MQVSIVQVTSRQQLLNLILYDRDPPKPQNSRDKLASEDNRYRANKERGKLMIPLLFH